MKMSQEHYQQLKKIISDSLEIIAENHSVSIKELIEKHMENMSEKAKGKDIEKLTRWNILWATPTKLRQPLISEMYVYLNDTHIDTALKKIKKELIV